MLVHQHSSENRWYSVIVVGVSSYFAKALQVVKLPKSFGYALNYNTSSLFIDSWTRLQNSICTSPVFPDPFLSEAFGKGSGFARLTPDRAIFYNT